MGAHPLPARRQDRRAADVRGSARAALRPGLSQVRQLKEATMARSFAGAGTALVTPFTPAGDLDEAALRRLVRRQIDAKIDALVPCGTTGESATMTPAEQERVVAITVEEAKGRVPVLAGAGSNDTKVAIERSKVMADLGADGILSVGPYYNKPTAEGF